MGTNGKRTVSDAELVRKLNEKASTWKPDDGHPKHHATKVETADLLRLHNLDAAKATRLPGLTPNTMSLIRHADRFIGQRPDETGSGLMDIPVSDQAGTASASAGGSLSRLS